MEQGPDFKELYQTAQCQIENLQKQVDYWELKVGMLRQLAEQQELLATAVELKLELLKSGAIDIRKLSL